MDLLIFLRLNSLSYEFYKIYPQSEKCLVLGRAPCQLHQRKIMALNQATISHKDSRVNRTVKQHFPQYAAFMSKVSKNIRK